MEYVSFLNRSNNKMRQTCLSGGNPFLQHHHEWLCFWQDMGTRWGAGKRASSVQEFLDEIHCSRRAVQPWPWAKQCLRFFAVLSYRKSRNPLPLNLQSNHNPIDGPPPPDLESDVHDRRCVTRGVLEGHTRHLHDGLRLRFHPLQRTRLWEDELYLNQKYKKGVAVNKSLTPCLPSCNM